MEKEVDSNLMVIKFENQKTPEFKQVRGKDWIYWGSKNEYPDYLIDLFTRSATHNAIITGKTNYIIGGGWSTEKCENLTERIKANNFINAVNSEETLNELSEKVVLDFEIYNGVALQIIWNKSKTDFGIYHIPFNKLRTNEDKSKYFYSKDWTSSIQNEEKTGLKEYKPFDFNKKENGVYVYQITAPKKGKDPNVYPMPEYIGSTQAIETDIECSNYNLSEIKTGFSAGTIINFYNGVPTKEEKESIREDLTERLTGSDRAGSWILNFADGKDRGSEVVSLSGNDLDKRYIELKKDVRQEIFTGAKVSSPMLFGVKTEGQLGGRAEIEEAYELFQNTYISRRQNIINKIFNKFLALKKVSCKIYLQPLKAISVKIPDALIEQAMSTDYVKEKLGIYDSSEVSNVAKSVIDGINSLSPLVANKVLESMSAEEIRSLVGLKGGVVTTIQRSESTYAKQKKESEILDAFSKIGRDKSLFAFYKSNELHDANCFTVSKYEKEYFANELKPNEAAIIDLLNKENSTPTKDIAKALKITDKEVINIIDSLIEREYLKPLEIGFKPTSDAIDIITEEAAKTANIELLYSYELRSNAPALKGESRPFCKELIKLNKLYTRSEIDNLSNGMGLDVFQYKGGWYTNPNTDAPTPQCRHIWKSHVVKMK